MTTLKELLAQKDELEAQIEAIRLSERAGAIEQALALITDYQLTQLDLFKNESPASPAEYKRPVAKVKAKYRDPATGKEWTGRGRQPRWISESGKDQSEFLIDKITSEERDLPIQSDLAN